MGKVAGLRWSLLVAMGIVPIACTGSSSNDDGARGKQSHAGSDGEGGAGGTPHSGPGGDAGQGGRIERQATCTAPVNDPLTGFVKCQEGYTHRVSPKGCVAESSKGGLGGEGGTRTLPRADGSYCEQDADCASFDLGYCQFSGSGGASQACASGCATDTDCGVGFICVCHGNGTPGGVCRRSNCTTDDDCGDKFLCASHDEGGGDGGFACQTAADECFSTEDCGGDVCGGDFTSGFELTALADIVDLVIAEGCFGETSAALEALEAAQTAIDPVVRGVYDRIARDEQHHAGLAFRFVRWAQRRAEREVTERIEATLMDPAPHRANAVTLPCLRALLGARGAELNEAS